MLRFISYLAKPVFYSFVCYVYWALLLYGAKNKCESVFRTVQIVLILTTRASLTDWLLNAIFEFSVVNFTKLKIEKKKKETKQNKIVHRIYCVNFNRKGCWNMFWFIYVSWSNLDILLHFSYWIIGFDLTNKSSTFYCILLFYLVKYLRNVKLTLCSFWWSTCLK